MFASLQTDKSKIPSGFIIFSSVILFLIFIIENINHHFWLNDFKVYYSAADAFIQNQQVYSVYFALGSGNFKYAPFDCLLFSPFTLLPYYAASVAYFFLSAASIILCFLFVYKLLNIYIWFEPPLKINTLLTIVFCCCLTLIVRELHLGNLNVVLLLLSCMSAGLILRNKSFTAGNILAFVIITKPFFILLGIPLLLRKQFRAIVSAVITGIVLILFPVPFKGIDATISLYKDWWTTISEHNASFPTNDTLFDIVKVYFGNLPDIFSNYFIMAGAVAVTLFCIFHRKYEKNIFADQQAGFLIEWFLYLAIIPSLFKTDSEHFLLALPLFMIFAYYVFKKKNLWLTLFFILIAFMYGGNSTDIVGKEFSKTLVKGAILGISNVLIITTAITIYFKNSVKQKNQYPSHG